VTHGCRLVLLHHQRAVEQQQRPIDAGWLAFRCTHPAPIRSSITILRRTGSKTLKMPAQISDSTLFAIASLLPYSSFEEIDVSGLRLEAEGWQALLEACSKCATLQALIIKDCGIGALGERSGSGSTVRPRVLLSGLVEFWQQMSAVAHTHHQRAHTLTLFPDAACCEQLVAMLSKCTAAMLDASQNELVSAVAACCSHCILVTIDCNREGAEK